MSDFTDKTIGNAMYDGHFNESFADDFMQKTDYKQFVNKDDRVEVASDEFIGKLR